MKKQYLETWQMHANSTCQPFKHSLQLQLSHQPLQHPAPLSNSVWTISIISSPHLPKKSPSHWWWMQLDRCMMADLLAGFFELVSSGILLATKPILVFKSTCLFGIRSLCIVIQTWIELLRTAIHVHLTIFWKLVVLTIGMLFLPMRFLTAIKRERQLEMHLNDMRIALEDFAWCKKELREQLKVTIKEHKMTEMMLAELEVENEDALFKIQHLERKVLDLKEENLLLKGVQGKFIFDKKVTDIHGGLMGTKVDNKDIWGEVCKRPSEVSETVRTEYEVWESNYKYAPSVLSTDALESMVVGPTRDVALSRSLFSALLSLLVGIIVWKAEDPCMPLIVALSAVVLMSLKSVVGFFSTIKNTPAMDAIALLSFNWFILGTLTYPVLPKVAVLLAPLGIKVMEVAFG